MKLDIAVCYSTLAYCFSNIRGRNGLTDQSDINIDYRDKITDTSMPPVQRRIL